MSDAEWDEAYRAAWTNYYTPEHMRTIMRRAAAHPLGRPGTALTTMLWFKLMVLLRSGASAGGRRVPPEIPA